MTKNTQITATNNSGHIPEVDGLRAVAVILVLLFHVGLGPFNAGYVGVDVFFVISGYLITGIILRDMERKKFNYFTFLSRRVSRLYPALTATLILTLFAGFLILTPNDYESLGISTVAAFFGVSNILFWQKSGYFDTSSETNPLLHTWSLGVEQQFYFAWPLLLLLVYKNRKNLILPTIIITFALSLAASQWMTSVNPSANYFLSPFRVFEFCTGSLLLWIRRNENFFLNEILMALGLSLIFYSALSFNSHTAFPGFNALVPTIGAALCIYSGSNSKLVGLLLRNKLSTYIGSISYSLYLVHWPIIVLYKYYSFSTLALTDKIYVLALCFIITIPLCHFVEMRYRRANVTSISPPYFNNIFSIGFILISLSSLIIFTGGLTFRVHEGNLARIDNPVTYHEERYGGTGYPMGYHDIGIETEQPVDVVILGDSLARQYADALDQKFKKNGIKAHYAIEDGCFISPGYTRIRSGQVLTECTDRMEHMLAYIEDKPNIPLIVSMNWQTYKETITTTDGTPIPLEEQDVFLDFLKSSMRNLLGAIGDRKLVAIGIPPGVEVKAGLASCLERPSYLPQECLNRLNTPRDKGYGRDVNEALMQLAKENQNFIFLNPDDALCEENSCQSLSNGDFIYSDFLHLSKRGAEVVIDYFDDDLNKLISRNSN